MMKFDSLAVYSRTYNDWTKEYDCITVKREKDNILLNISASIIWEYLDSKQPVGRILDHMIGKYGDDNTIDSLEKVLIDSLQILLQEGLIKEFDKRVGE